ncbi:MAG: translation initiation factor IF-2 [Spirosomaceae bacterium]|nr:translation initiation factor IF-2 [Spirosomataceae bacterium]
MAENKEMRLSLAAKKLNVGIQTIVEKLAAKGQRIENNPNAKLNFEQLQLLSTEFKTQVLFEESMAKPTVEEARTPTTPSSEILYFRGPSKTEEKPAEPSKPKEPEVVRIERNLDGPKILGKIELDKNNNPVVPKPEPKPEPVTEPVVEAPKVVETPKVEEKPVVVEAPKVVETPKVEEKPAVVESKPEPAVAEQPKPEPKLEPLTEAPKAVETPKVEIPKAPEQRPQPNQNQQRPNNDFRRDRDQRSGEQQQRPDFQKNRPQDNRPPQNQPKKEEFKPKPKPVVVEEEDVPVELIMAKAEKLQGLKVLGKIELPVEKKTGGGNSDDKKKRKRKRVKRAEKVNSDEVVAKNKEAAARPNNPNPNRGGGQQGQPNTNNNTNTNNQGNNKRKKERREEVSQVEVKEQIKQTMARMQTKGPDFGAKFRKDKRKQRAEAEEQRLAAEQQEEQILKVTEFISASDLASMMDVSVNEVIASCMGMGMFVSINQRLDAEAIQMIALEFGYDVQFISAEEEIRVDAVEIADAPEDLEHRAPIITIMGHVDHGKTSLLDYIRRERVAAGEAGGITQHIGAYAVTIKEGPNKGKKIAFLDTPGHEAFTAMRARGAKVTDIVIIVIAADDSVMPQTREAINHAQNAGVPIVFALNKIDKPGANSNKIREDLAKENILVESWGGKYQEQEVSAKSGLGVSDLLDKVLLEAELLELKANPDRKAVGTVIEAALDKGRGYVATILVENGTLKVGDVILAGQYFGRVRAMIDDKGQRIKEAGPSTPVQILGLPGAPQAGDRFNVMETEREAREIANKREQIIREQSLRARKHITLDEIGRRKAIGSFQQLNLIVKGDFDGSVEALSDSLQKLSTEEVHVNIIHKAVGQISESDVNLAAAGDAIIVGFQVRPSINARKIAEQEQIEIRLYSVIYDAINEIKDAMEGMLAPKEEEVIVGTIEVRETFKISKVGTIAGCYVLDGSFKRNNKVRVIREGIVIHEGEIAQLKRFKDDVNEVKSGYECGMSFKGFNDLEVGDTLESYEMKEVKRTL